MCLYPTLYRNPKFKPNKKNGGQVPPVNDERTLYVPVGCKKCIECKNQKRREWQVRLQEEIKTAKNGKFITLTFSNDSIRELTKYIRDKETKLNQKCVINGYPLDNAIASTAVRLFLERYRKKFKTSIRHWLITELGHNGTENIHLHGILWTDSSYETLCQYWKYGYIWPRNKETKTYVNNKTINYCVKYVTKTDIKHPNYDSLVLCSDGIGGKYINTQQSTLNKYKGKNTNEAYTTQTGHKVSLPIYYRNKIYTDEQKEQLWIEKLNKNERWVRGTKIKADDTETYYKVLNYHREQQKQYGYSKPKYNQTAYEHERRKLIQLQRLQADTKIHKQFKKLTEGITNGHEIEKTILKSLRRSIQKSLD